MQERLYVDPAARHEETQRLGARLTPRNWPPIRQRAEAPSRPAEWPQLEPKGNVRKTTRKRAAIPASSLVANASEALERLRSATSKWTSQSLAEASQTPEYHPPGWTPPSRSFAKACHVSSWARSMSARAPSVVSCCGAANGAGEAARLIDSDVGQKMVGPPAFVTLGQTTSDAELSLLEWVFVGRPARY